MTNASVANDAEAIMGVIEQESRAFWDKDYDAWAACWVHAPYTRTMGWWQRGGVTVLEGWDVQSERIGQVMAANPEPNPTAYNVRRANINLRVSAEMAWLTFDQFGEDTADPDMDMPGLSRETRILEKHDGVWKIVYAGWLLEGR